MPTGGVNLETLPAFIKAGACALGVGGSLADIQAIREGNFAKLRDSAAQYVQALKAARGE
jgi:2-dehydro-3-deoxyphosphogluconate aldolase / (4S)-4-hydroxy-2-oxoglutarate aldolase